MALEFLIKFTIIKQQLVCAILEFIIYFNPYLINQGLIDFINYFKPPLIYNLSKIGFVNFILKEHSMKYFSNFNLYL